MSETWGEWETGMIPAGRLAELERLDMHPDRIVMNKRYEVWVRVIDGPWGLITWLSIKRRDKAPIHDWRDLQRIKNDLAGPEVEAVEIYPAESRLVDTANQYHLWCLPQGFQLPFGFRSRLVAEGKFQGSVQRGFAPGSRPADLVDLSEVAGGAQLLNTKEDAE